MNESTEVRLTILENEVKNIKDKLSEMHVDAKEHREMTFSIKEKLNAQNGAIPHLADDMKEIKEALYSHIKDETLDIKTIVSFLEKKPSVDSEMKVKLKILWGITSAIGLGVLGVIFKLLFGS